jgi:uncharacterized protein (DUF2249 family)
MKNTPAPLELDVRPMLASKRPPLPAIMDAVSRLEDGQSLRLTAPFDPAPLRDLLAARGFDNTTTETGPGVWVVEFTPRVGH